MTQVPYANVVGNLMYAIVCTMPDLSQAVSMINIYMHDPSKGPLEDYGTIDVSLVFEKDSTSKQ